MHLCYLYNPGSCSLPPTHPFLSLPRRLFGADAPCLSMTLVYPQVSWSSYYMGIGMATTSAHIPLGMTTSQSIALSAPLPMVLSSSSEQLFPSLAPLLSCQATVSSPLICDSHLGFIVSAASDPIPHRLLQRIRNGEFVEMR